MIGEISDALERGEMVKILSFGSFTVRRKGQRIGRNPKTGREVPISPRRILRFRAAPAMKRQVDKALMAGQDSAKEHRPLRIRDDEPIQRVPMRAHKTP